MSKSKSATASGGYKYGTPAQQSQFLEGEPILSREEYTRLETRRRELRKTVAEINQKLNGNKEFRGTFKTPGEWNRWVQSANAQRAQYLAEYEQVNDLVCTFAAARKSVVKERQSRLKGFEVVEVLRRAVRFLQALSDEHGMSEECENIMMELGSMIGAESVLLSLINRREMDAALEATREQHARDLAIERSASQQAAATLRSQLRDLQGRRGRANDILARLYAERYEEVDQFRRARGVTYRLHLTDEDCKAIEEALRG